MVTKIQGSGIDTDTITAGNIAAGAVGASELATDSVEAAEIKAGAVGTSEIEDGSVAAGDLAGLGAVNDPCVADLRAMLSAVEPVPQVPAGSCRAVPQL